MSGLSAGVSRFGRDDGSAESRVAAALAAFAAGQGSEHAALTSLAQSRLLVPIVAVAADGAGTGEHADGAGTGKHASEMSVPTLIGADGRAAIPAFTCMDALRSWRPQARPVPTAAQDVWRAAVADGCAVVVDVAGPVPLAIDGALLAALAGGEPVPLPHQDPEVLAQVRAAVAGLPAVTGLSLDDGGAECDLVVRLQLAPGCGAAVAAKTADAAGTAVMARLGGRLRRGIAIAVDAGPAAAAP